MNRVHGETATQRAVKRRQHSQEQYKKLVQSLCEWPAEGKHLQMGSRELRGVHASLKIKPQANEWLPVCDCSDNRKCGLPLMFIHVLIKNVSTQKYIYIYKNIYRIFFKALLQPDRSNCRDELKETDLLLPSCASNHVPKQQWGQASARSFGWVNKEH